MKRIILVLIVLAIITALAAPGLAEKGFFRLDTALKSTSVAKKNPAGTIIRPEPPKTSTVAPRKKNAVTDNLRDRIQASALLLVNKQHSLSPHYVPPDLVIPDIPFLSREDPSKMQMRREAGEAIENLVAQARREGIELMGVSAYRSYERQSAIFARNAALMGKTEANRLSAYPGQSEHQTGLAIDISGPGNGYRLNEDFGATREGRWLQGNAHRFGFIIRYPQGKEYITGYRYEPWHLRYVGPEHAAAISQSKMTLEEYMENR